MLHLKQELFNKCLEFVDERIASTEKAISQAKDASQDDTKSSAGDKYETTREMMQQEISRNEAQLLEAKKLKHALLQIPVTKNSKIVENGSIVLTNNGNFFIAISAGQMTVNGLTHFVISSASPICRLMLGLKKGGKFSFNGKNFEIEEVG
jgi:transcription elongation GreA/GreB family factor